MEIDPESGGPEGTAEQPTPGIQIHVRTGAGETRKLHKHGLQGLEVSGSDQDVRGKTQRPGKRIGEKGKQHCSITAL